LENPSQRGRRPDDEFPNRSRNDETSGRWNVDMGGGSLFPPMPKEIKGKNCVVIESVPLALVPTRRHVGSNERHVWSNHRPPKPGSLQLLEDGTRHPFNLPPTIQHG
jgi:hypothetical protein